MTPPIPAARLQQVQAPIIPEIAGLIRDHPGTISLGQGVVAYGPPPQVLESLRQFGTDPDQHRYGPAAGDPELLELIAAKLQRENRMGLAGRRIFVTAGANMGFLHALFAIADPGAEVILPLPFYFNQEMAVRMLGCRPVPVATDADYRLDPVAVRAAITPRTRAVVTISPNNPTGMVYDEAELRDVNALCRESGIYHISDEAYENFVYDGASHFSPGSISGAEQHTLSLYSLSKAYGFAGWRIGYLVIPEHLAEAVTKVQDTNLICAPRISQHAAAAALRVGSAYCSGRLPELAEVRRQVLEELAALGDSCRLPPARGAFYLLLKAAIRLDSLSVARRLIEEHRVAVIPGIAFGLTEGCYLRLSYGALDGATAREGARRLVQGLDAIAATAPAS